MHAGPALGEHVRRPIPPVRRLQDDLGGLPGPRHYLGQPDRVVVDLYRLEQLAGSVFAHDHAATTVQVDADILFVHGGPPSSLACCGRPKFPSPSGLGRSGDPRPLRRRRHLRHQLLPAVRRPDRTTTAHRARAALRSCIPSSALECPVPGGLEVVGTVDIAPTRSTDWSSVAVASGHSALLSRRWLPQSWIA